MFLGPPGGPRPRGRTVLPHVTSLAAAVALVLPVALGALFRPTYLLPVATPSAVVADVTSAGSPAPVFSLSSELHYYAGAVKGSAVHVIHSLFSVPGV